MVELPVRPPLIPLHPDRTLNAGKLEKFEKISTEALLASLQPGLEGCLKTRPDGTILDGHHRICILRGRGVNVEALPRDVVIKKQD